MNLTDLPRPPVYCLGLPNADGGDHVANALDIATANLWDQAEPARAALATRVLQVSDRLSWCVQFTVEPGDATTYRVTVSYDAAGRNPYTVSLEGEGCYSIPVKVYGTDADVDTPHPGYLADKVSRRHANTWGLHVAMGFASQIMAARALTLARYDGLVTA